MSSSAAVLLLALKKSLYPRAGFGEAITVMQQWFLSLVLGHTPFDLVNLLICEWEDWIASIFKGKGRIPYAHVMCYLLAKTVGFLEQEMVLRESKSIFPDYKSLGLTDRHRGGSTMRALHDDMTPTDIANNEEADLALRELEARSGL
jgi:hypothetical protein